MIRIPQGFGLWGIWNNEIFGGLSRYKVSWALLLSSIMVSSGSWLRPVPGYGAALSASSWANSASEVTFFVELVLAGSEILRSCCIAIKGYIIYHSKRFGFRNFEKFRMFPDLPGGFGGGEFMACDPRLKFWTSKKCHFVLDNLRCNLVSKMA